MPDTSSTFDTVIFEKTEVGQQEIQTRALGLPFLVRRVLLLVDGKRSGQELTQFAGGQDIAAMFQQLLDKGCIAVKTVLVEAPAPAPTVPADLGDSSATTAPQAALQGSADIAAQGLAAQAQAALPPADARSPKQMEMARHFMINTVNTMFGQHNRITFIETVSACRTVEELRAVYPQWVQTMEGSAIGTRRLPELREKLFAVL